ncbi:hypothetical protein GPJ56_006473 [Histomonas meleagridis]|uniref:uncharacterized protein n=1 Tax=Histomonas meleagridis TaxID=135588 RepID=UPI003559D568|nr:hypothetical protein GPJ56_006473 [Histomonas meleagridis]KAH0799822.1 hypothetical protein GO595_006934 [Histomonas meleagridis]
MELGDLLASNRYKKSISEIADTIDNSVQEVPFVEPRLCTFLDESIARKLLEEEITKNETLMQETQQIYQEIIKDVLYTELEIIPLGKQKREMWSSLENTVLSKLIQKYEIHEREEASLIAKYRDENKQSKQVPSLQSSVYEVESANRRLKKEIKTLNLQLKRTAAELESEKNSGNEEEEGYEEMEQQLESIRHMEQQIIEINQQIDKGKVLHGKLTQKCDMLQEEIQEMMNELVSLNSKNTKHK